MKLIICIDGGGTRGILAASILRKVIQALNLSIKNIDLLAGTSTGSIITTLLASGHDIDEIIEWYYEKSKDIFKAKRLFGLFEEKYDAHTYEKILHEYLDFTGDKLKTKVLIPLTNLTQQTLDVYKSWKSSKALYTEKVCNVVRAATAAPVFFEPVILPSTNMCYADGGLICNDPTLCAYVESKKLWGKEPRIFISIGCGIKYQNLTCDEARRWGAVQWLPRLINLFVNSYYEVNLMNRIYSFEPNLYYFRLNPALPPDIKISLDVTDREKLAKLVEVGEDYVEQYLDSIVETYKVFTQDKQE